MKKRYFIPILGFILLIYTYNFENSEKEENRMIWYHIFVTIIILFIIVFGPLIKYVLL